MQILAFVVATLLGGLAGYALGLVFGWPGIILAFLSGISIGVGCGAIANWSLWID